MKQEKEMKTPVWKKAISILLAILMLTSVISVCFPAMAEEIEEIREESLLGNGASANSMADSDTLYDFDAMPSFYADGQYVGISSHGNSERDFIYQINGGEWKTYSHPFAIPHDIKVTLRAKYTTDTDNDNYIVTTYSANADLSKYVGVYTTSVTDYTVTNNLVSFPIARTYSSNTNKWFYSFESKIETDENTMSVLYYTYPDSTKRAFERVNDTTYKNILTGQEIDLTFNSDTTLSTYNVKFNGLTYTYNSAGKLISVTNDNGESLFLTHSASSTTFSSSFDYATTLSSVYFDEENNNRVSYISISGEKILYNYENDNLTSVKYDDETLKVKRDGGIILGEYEYQNNKLKTNGLIDIQYNNLGYLSKETHKNGAYVSYSYENTNSTYTVVENCSDGSNETNTYSSDFSLLSSSDNFDNSTTYTYDDCYRVTKEVADGITTNYTYDSNGNTTKIETQDLITEYAYNDNNDVIKKTETNSTDDSVLYTYYQYFGRKILNTCTSETNYTGDVPVSVFENADTSIMNTYSDSGLITNSVVHNVSTDGTITNGEYTYSSALLSNSVESITTDSETTETTSVYTYNDKKQVSQCDITVSTDNSEYTQTNTYTYDGRYRTTSLREDGEIT